MTTTRTSGPEKFAPVGLGAYEPLFRGLSKELVALDDWRDRLFLVRQARAQVEGNPTASALRYRASLWVLHDLLSHGWRPEWFGHNLHLHRPERGGESVSEQKARQREALMMQTREQLEEPSVAAFLAGMRADPNFQGLTADGAELSARLSVQGVEGVTLPAVSAGTRREM